MRTHEREIKKTHRTAHNIWLTKKEVNEGIFIYAFVDKHNLEYHSTLRYHRICQKINFEVRQKWVIFQLPVLVN